MIRKNCKTTFRDYLARHPVFTLGESREAFAGQLTETAVFKRVRHAVGTGRVVAWARGLYAVVPLGSGAKSYQPDAFHVLGAFRQDAVLGQLVN